MNGEIDLSQYMTTEEAEKAIKCSRRSLYRAMARAGGDVSIEFLGRRLVRRDKLDAIKAAFFPFGSKSRSAMAKVWGAAGGTQKGVNFKKKARAAKRASRATKRDDA